MQRNQKTNLLNPQNISTIQCFYHKEWKFTSSLVELKYFRFSWNNSNLKTIKNEGIEIYKCKVGMLYNKCYMTLNYIHSLTWLEPHKVCFIIYASRKSSTKFVLCMKDRLKFWRSLAIKYFNININYNVTCKYTSYSVLHR